jgi:small subunit ribosomal protein S17
MKTLTGIVTRVANPRTVKVEVARNWQHPLYKKYVKRTKSYLVDVPADLQLEVGNEVVIQECAPVSKTKTFKVVEKHAEKEQA